MPLRWFLLLIALTLRFPAFAAEPTSTSDPANVALQQGRVDDATNLLRAALTAQPNNAMAHQLLCRVFYTQEQADAAVRECELAVSQAPGSSENHMWLGRAYGLKASSMNPFTAIGLAKKVRDEFERAVQLDPNAPRAASDLGQFYIDAPSMFGGGTDKANALIERMEPRFPAYSHRLRARLAEKMNDGATAETEFKKVISLGNTAAAWVDLADFYRRNKQMDKAVSAIQSALTTSPKDAALVDASNILTATRQLPDLAERLLREYLVSPLRTDEAPAFKVHLQLGKLLAKRKDNAGAHAEYSAAVALASNYSPARKALERS